MNYGLYISTSGMLTNMARLDVASNNLANVNTIAFKPDFVGVAQRDPVTIEDGIPFEDSNRLLEKLGAGPWPTANAISFEPGAIELTGQDLDVAIEGEGFLVLRDGGPEDYAYTRDGNLAINARSILVSASTGKPVLSEDGREIRIDTSRKLLIHADGRVEQDGGEIGQLRIRGISDLSQLRKAGDNLFKIDENVPLGVNLETRVDFVLEQGALEQSSVNPVSATLAVTQASRAASGASRMIQYFDGFMDSAINTLGRVS
ncbi:MAG: flagellar hook-basal body protein [Phycisphaerales bacterium]